MGDKARRFGQEGMRGLGDQRAGQAGRHGQRDPAAVAAYRLYVKQLSPPIHARDRVRIVPRKGGDKTTHHPVQHCRARHASPGQLEGNLRTLRECADAYHARWTVGRLWYEGWTQPRRAGGLKLARAHVYAIIEACARAGGEGLEAPRTRPFPPPDDQGPLPGLQEVLDLQQAYPRAGRLRMHTGGWSPSMAPTGPGKPPGGEPGRSIGACRRRPAPGRAPEPSRRRRPSPAPCRIARRLGPTSGVSLFGRWASWRAAGAIASVLWQAPPA